MLERSQNCLKKVERMWKTLHHQEPDRVPVTEAFWSSFIKRWREELALPPDADPYRYYDMDYIITTPNIDPHIKTFEVLKENDEEITVRTGFEAIIQKKFDKPMPAYLHFETDTIEKMGAFEFDDPWADKRYFKGGDNQIAGVGDTFSRNLPPWVDTVTSLYPDIPVYGSVCEGYETLWRIIGSENALIWIGMYPDEVGKFVERINQFSLELAKAQVKAADGKLAGMVVFGDVAYRKDVFFSPKYWRTYFKPGVTAIVDFCHENNLPVVYHGCGNVNRIFEDFIETGIDAYNPLEVKAGMDVIDLRRKYGHRIGFCGNTDVINWALGSDEEITGEVMRKLNAAKGGGYIFASDHSIPSNISGERYDMVIKLVRDKGRYPLKLGEFDLPDLG